MIATHTPRIGRGVHTTAPRRAPENRRLEFPLELAHLRSICRIPLDQVAPVAGLQVYVCMPGLDGDDVYRLGQVVEANKLYVAIRLADGRLLRQVRHCYCWIPLPKR